MTNSFLLGKDSNGATTYSLPVSSNIASTTLAAGVAQSLTIPAGVTQAVFSYSNGVDVWVEFKTSTAAALPVGGFVFGTKELNPVARYGLVGGNTLSFISPTTAYVEVYFAS